MTWEQRLVEPQTTEYLLALIDGAPFVISSMDLDPTFAPAGYAVFASLDLSEGVTDAGQQLNRKGGIASPTTLSLRFDSPETEDVGRWLRGDWSIRTPVAGSVSFTDATIVVSSTAGFPAGPGVACLGPETFTYTGTTPTSFTGCTRGAFGSAPEQTIQEAGFLSGTRWVTDVPPFLEGRRVRLFLGLANLGGQPLDTGLGGTYQREVWAGIVDSVDLEQNFVHVQVSGRTLAVALESDVGGYPASAKLGYTGVDEVLGSLSWFTLMQGAYIPAGGESVRLSVEDGAGTITPITVTIPTGWTNTLVNEVCVAVQAGLAAALNPANPQYFECWYLHQPPTWSDENTEPWEVGLGIYVKFQEPGKTYKLTWIVEVGDPLYKLGFDYGEWVPSDNSSGANELYRILINKIPPMLTVGSSDTEILVWQETGNYGEVLPASGFAVIEDGTNMEVIYYGSLTEMVPGGLYRLNAVERGRMNTSPQTFTVETKDVVADKASNTPAAAGDSPRVTVCLGFEGQGLLTIFLKLCMSTGTPGTRHATYDSSDVVRGQGLGLPSEWFDIPRFEEVEAELETVVRERSMLWRKPFSLSTWIGKELAALGWCLLTKPTAAGYQMTLERLHSPLLVGKYTLDEDDIHTTPWPTQRRHRRDVINEVEMSLVWNAPREQWESVKVIVRDVDSQQDYRTRSTIRAEMKGLYPALGTATEVSQLYGPPLIALYSRMYSLVRLGVRRRAWLFHAGDHVTVSLSRIIQGVEVPIWNSEAMIVTRAGAVYAGDGSQALATLDLLSTKDRRLSYWCPSGYINSYVVGPPPTITLRANEFTSATQVVPWTGELARDADFFADGMVVWVCNPGDEASAVLRTLSNRAGDTYDLDSALPVGMGANSVITFPDWAACDTFQQSFVHVADKAGTLGPGNDPAFMYSE